MTACGYCGGFGWTNYILPVEHPDHGKAFRCECKKAEDEAKRQAKLFEGAGVPAIFHDLTMETFPWEKKGTAEQRKRLADWMLTFNPPGLVLYGPVGRGKTGLAVGVLKLMTQRGTPSLFITVANLMDKLRDTQKKDSEATEKQVLDAVKNVTFLVLDDLGRERPTDFQNESMFKVVDHRYSNGLRTIYTTNLDTKDLGGHLGAASASRIVSSCLCLEMAGPYLRPQPITVQPNLPLNRKGAA